MSSTTSTTCCTAAPHPPLGEFSPCSPTPPAPSHLPSLSVPGHGHTQDVGGLFHDSDKQVVDVVLELPHLEVLPGDGVLLFQHQLDQLIVCQLSVRIGRV